MWLVFALLVPFFFAAVFILDSYCVDDVFERPWIGMITSSIVSLVVFAPIPFIAPFIDWTVPSLSIAGMAILAGVIVQVNQALYFEALSHSDSSAVASYWNMVPAFLPMASYLLFSEVLDVGQYIGIAILIATSICICLLDIKVASKQNAFWLILGASWLQIIAILLLDIVYRDVHFYTGFILFTVGLVVAGFFPLAFEENRITFKHQLPIIKRLFKLFAAIEILNLLGYASLQMGLKLGNASLVGSLEAATPAFVLFLAAVLYITTGKRYALARFSHLPQKIVLIILMVGGVALLT